MQIDIAGIAAKCISCGGREFVSLSRTFEDRAHKMACARCFTKVLYDDLLSQIARNAIADSSYR